jgi:hypothetical protein
MYGNSLDSSITGKSLKAIIALDGFGKILGSAVS